jgi:chromosome segregation ATPase
MHFLLSDPAAGTSTPWYLIPLMILGAIGGATGIIALLTLPLTRKKMGSDITQTDAKTETERANQGVILSTAALAQMEQAIRRAESLQSERDTDKNRMNDLEDRIDELESEHRRYIRNAEDHAAWDKLMVKELRERGFTPPDPPPLFPLGAV